MRKIIALLILFLFLAYASPVMAAPPDYNGGINNEYQYTETVFVTGQPLDFAGTIKITESERNNKKTVTYKITLASKDTTLGGKVDRQFTYETNYSNYSDKGQTMANTTLTKYKETISIGADKYNLTDYQFSRSDAIDNCPASDFYSGNITGRKYYEINPKSNNRRDGEVTVNISGGMVGYENFWGNTETQLLQYSLDANRNIAATESTDAKTIYWQGTVNVAAVDSMNKTLRYSENEASLASFDGGQMRITQQSMYASYNYDLPHIVEGEPQNSRRNINNADHRYDMAPKVERLIIPKFRDTGGHPAQADIEKLYSLDVFEGTSQFFVPDAPMTRVSFIRAIVTACNIRPTEVVKTTSRTKKAPVETSPFIDLPGTDENYPYVKDAISKNLISGLSGTLFGTDEPLTKAQAITIIIRALGFENNVPTPGYRTAFSDDSAIPAWAKNSVYAAHEIGLISGDAANRINPNSILTRAEGSVLLIRFLEFLEKDLQKDYRDNIVLYQ